MWKEQKESRWQDFCRTFKLDYFFPLPFPSRQRQWWQTHKFRITSFSMDLFNYSRSMSYVYSCLLKHFTKTNIYLKAFLWLLLIKDCSKARLGQGDYLSNLYYVHFFGNVLLKYHTSIILSFSQEIRHSDCKCRYWSSPGFNRSNLRNNGSWVMAD